MADSSKPWDGTALGDASEAPYSSTEWARTWRLRNAIGDTFNPYLGVLKGTGNGTYEPLFVAATNPASANVEIYTGAALVDGRLYETDTVVALTVQSNGSGNPRVDSVILRIDYVAQTITPVIKQGTPAVSPVAPTLQQDTSIWEMALADIAVANGFSTISQSNITQRQYYTSIDAVGWQPYALSPVYRADTNYNAGVGIAFSSNGFTAVFPFFLHSNMLLDRVTMIAAVTQLTMAFDLYVQDNNSGLSAQNTLRRVAHGDEVLTTTVLDFRTIDADFPTILTPGTYWLALQRQDAGGAFTIAGADVNSTTLLEGISAATKVTAIPNGQTLDFVAITWTRATDCFAIRLDGRVFGETTPWPTP